MMALPNCEKHNGTDFAVPKALETDLKTQVDQSRSESDPTSLKAKTCKTKAKKAFKDNSLMILTLIGVIIGFALGFGLRQAHPSREAILWLEMPGEIFIRLLKLSIVPLIASNVVIVTSSLDPNVNGKISLVAFVYIIIANILAAVIGLTLSLVIKPGAHGSYTSSATEYVQMQKLSTSDVFADFILNIFPDNIIGATLLKTETMYVRETDRAIRSLIEIVKNDSSFDNETIRSMVIFDKRIVSQSPGVNMTGILFCAFVFGLAARCVEESDGVFLAFFKSLNKIVIQLIRWFLWITPIGVCFMIAGSVSKLTNITDTILNLGMFAVTFTVGLGTHFLVMNLVLLIASRQNPLAFLLKCFKAWLMAFVTASSVVAVPEIYDCCEAHGISPAVYRIVIPLTAALKGDGPALFITSAAVFIAQISAMTLNAENVILLVLLSAASTLAIPNIPGASIVILVTICNSVGIPVKPVALLFSIEWLLDRMRAGLMGLGHAYCTAFTYYVCRKDVKAKEPTSESQNKEDIEFVMN